jgi:hypothetical protein
MKILIEILRSVRLSKTCSEIYCYEITFYFSMLKPLTKIYGLLYGLQRYEDCV